jgi:hypothetical protein
MAITNVVYPKGIIHFIQGDIDLDGVAVKAGLLDDAVFTYNAANEVYGDISGIVGTPVALASKTVGVVGTGAVDAADTTIVAVSGAHVEGDLVYYDGTTKYLICTNVFSAPVTPNGGDITIQWNASGIFSL